MFSFSTEIGMTEQGTFDDGAAKLFKNKKNQYEKHGFRQS